jgi:predicted nucleotidyltransferase
MEQHAILERLRANEAMLRDLGVTHAALFGSRARGDHRPDSDTDILIELDQERRLGMWGYARAIRVVEELFSGSVDVVPRDSLKDRRVEPVTKDAIYAF